MRNFLNILLCGLMVIALPDNALANNSMLSHLSGSVTIKKADGSKLATYPGVEVESGDAIVTGSNGYARLQTTDGGEIVLRPNSEFHIEKYHYDQAKPEDDSFIYNMLKGGLRTITGLIGKRGNKNAYLGRTATSTIGIRGTQFQVRVCANDCGALPNGTYYSVQSGSILTGNAQGNLTMTTGQFVFVPLNGQPTYLPNDPGVGFTPPSTIPKPTQNQQGGDTPADSPAESSIVTPSAGSAQDGVNCSIN